MGEEKYYIQDSRSHTGNCVMWWKHDNCGYVTNIKEAKVWSKEAAFRQHEMRDTDIPWPKDYIDTKTRPTVDFQYLDKGVAFPKETP